MPRLDDQFGYMLLGRRDRPGSGEQDVRLADILDALGAAVGQWRWSVSSTELSVLEGAPAPAQALGQLPSADALWLSGDELRDTCRHLGFVNWGAFLAYRPEEADFAYASVPRSEGADGGIQHAHALVEIQSVDGGFFEVFTRLPDVAQRLRRRFRHSRPGQRSWCE